MKFTLSASLLKDDSVLYYSAQNANKAFDVSPSFICLTFLLYFNQFFFLCLTKQQIRHRQYLLLQLHTNKMSVGSGFYQNNYVYKYITNVYEKIYYTVVKLGADATSSFHPKLTSYGIKCMCIF